MSVRRLIVCFSLAVGAACNPISERKQPPPSLGQLAKTDLNLSGEQLANAYCGNCHIKPEPQVLDKETWEKSVLPDMRKRLGLYLAEDFGNPLPQDMGIPDGVYSQVPLIKEENWVKLVTYYLENAPEEPLPQREKELPKKGIPGFEVSQPEYPFPFPNLTTLLKIHPETGKLWLGHRFQKVFILDSESSFTLEDSISVGTAPVDIRWNEDQTVDILSMGLMDPSNDSLGAVGRFTNKGGRWDSVDLLTGLVRPVHMEFGDWNSDGVEDYVISGFGDHLGKLSLFLSGDSGHKEVVLKAKPGARRTVAVDFDGDGKLDVLGLMTQAEEGIFVWINQGDGTFRERNLIKFHPAFGSSDFRYEDINGDGFKDIVLVNGDNADLSIVLKNYHGVRVFLNNGKGTFSEEWFYPLYGASGIEVADFNGDGRLDFFVLAFFPDQEQHPKQDLVYFRQNSKGGFDPFVMKQDFDSHWLTMTSGDLDRDGDLDLIVGAFEFDDLYGRGVRPWRPFIVLENKLKSR